jgi:hypothetical protein
MSFTEKDTQLKLSAVYPLYLVYTSSTYLYAPETMLPTQFLQKGKNKTLSFTSIMFIYWFRHYSIIFK